MKLVLAGALALSLPALANDRMIIDGRSVKTTDGRPLIVYPNLNITPADCFIGPLQIADPQGRVILTVDAGSRVPTDCSASR